MTALFMKQSELDILQSGRDITWCSQVGFQFCEFVVEIVSIKKQFTTKKTLVSITAFISKLIALRDELKHSPA